VFVREGVAWRAELQRRLARCADCALDDSTATSCAAPTSPLRCPAIPADCAG